MKQISAVLLVFALCLSACGGRGNSQLVIGSKNFTEQTVLAELLSQYLESKLGIKVEQRANLGGTLICHEAVKSGQIDLYVEYTGTALTAVLNKETSSDPATARRLVKEGYDKEFGLEVTEPLGFDNSFAMVIRGEDARKLNLRTLSEAVVPAIQWRAGFGYEFMERPDGFPGLARTYGLKFAQAPLLMDLGLLYRALEEKQVDIVAGAATDGVIAARGFVVLEDDRHYFPPYEAVPIVNRKAFERHPKLRETLASLGGNISAEAMRRLNYAVDGEHRDVRDVVREFLAMQKL